jgi:chlorite dismutase
MSARLFSFVAGDSGAWRIVELRAIVGATLAPAARLEVVNAPLEHAVQAWVLRGVTSNERYVRHDERRQLVDRQPVLGRAQATCATLIPIRKSDAWWGLSQDERRRIFEERSRHIETGMRYLPAVARRLHHCRDLGTPEPFDFLTWFEYAPADVGNFDRLLRELRDSEEWAFVEREVEIRLAR